MPRARTLLTMIAAAACLVPALAAPGLVRAAPATPATAVGDVPPPAACTVAPRTAASLRALTGTPSAGLATPATTATPFVPPAGHPVDPVTLAAITATMREEIACVNAGDLGRQLALYTDDLLRRFIAANGGSFTAALLGDLATPAAALPPASRVALMAVRDARVLPDGRVGAIVVTRHLDETALRTNFAVFVKLGGRWLIDEVVPNPVETGPAPAAPTPTRTGLLLGPTPTPTSGGLLLGPTSTPTPTPTATVEPTATTQTGVVGNSYVGPATGVRLTWSAAWSVVTQTSANGADQLVLNDGTTLVELDAGPAGGTTLASCVDQASQSVATNAGLANLAVGTDANGNPLRGTDPTRPSAVFTATLTTSSQLGAAGAPIAFYLECRQLPGNELLLFVALTPLGSYNAEVPAVQALLAALVLP